MHYRVQLGAILALSGILGCKPDRQPAGTGQTAAITVKAKDFAFEAPAEVPAGQVTVKLVNEGTDLHHAQLIKIEEGKTLDDVVQAVKAGGQPPSWIKFVGGPNAIPPGHSSEATAVLEPGRYAYVCVVFGADGVMHVFKGMMQPFEVTGAMPASAGLPTAQATITLMDYDFKLSQPLRPGQQTILVENEGPQPHEVALLKLGPGKTVEDFAHWAEHGMKGPPPALPLGGVVLLDKGASGTFTADLAPGEYGLMCFVPDAKDGKPHLAHGMMKTIKVSAPST